MVRHLCQIAAGLAVLAAFVRRARGALFAERSGMTAWFSARAAMRAHTALLAALGCIFVSVSDAYAYQTFADDPDVGYPARWPEIRLQWHLSVNEIEAVDGVSVELWEDTSVAAFATWQAVECMPVVPELVSVSADPAAIDDGRSTITFVTDGWVERGFPDRAAFTEVVFRRAADGTAEIREADVFLDASTHSFVTGVPGPGELDLQSVLTHEVGHVLGLRHSCGDPGAPACESSTIFATSVMHPQYRGREGHSLGGDDIAGICAIYAAGDDCSVTCPAGLECERGVCVDPTCGESMCEPTCDDLASPCEGGRCSEDGVCVEGDCALAGHSEGWCIRPGTTGTPCSAGEDCESRLCLTSVSVGSYCTFECRHDADCAGLQRCSEVDGSNVCVPLPPGGTCAIVSGEQGGHAGWLLCSMTLFSFLRRRKPQ